MQVYSCEIFDDDSLKFGAVGTEQLSAPNRTVIAMVHKFFLEESEIEKDEMEEFPFFLKGSQETEHRC